jgi:Bacterial pre-peptidase C-terminal domain
MNRAIRRAVAPVLPLCSLCLCGFLLQAADEKKPDKKDAPRVIVTAPLGIVPGMTTRLTVRGVKLDTATAVRFTDSNVTAKVLGKGKVPLGKDQDPAKFGDSQVEVEVALPPGSGPDAGSFVVITPGGESTPHQLLVETALPVVAEKEPNNGFQQAQPIAVPQVVDGTVHQPQDVDVFRFEGKAGQHVLAEVLAARHGSALDSVLTLYDADGRELASSDDAEGSTDSRLDVTLPRDGAYYLSLLDAHDQGGPAHVYRLIVRLK